MSVSGNQAARWLLKMITDMKQRALQDQTRYQLHISLTEQKIWTTAAEMPENEQQDAEKKAVHVSGDIFIKDIAYPQRGIISEGTAVINFSKNGYSDKALIHINDSANRQLSLLIEPFLNKVDIFKGYLRFEE